MALDDVTREHAVESGDYRGTSTLFALWFAMLGGPLATALVTGTNYAITSRACENESVGWLYATNLLALAVSAAALAISYRMWQRFGGGKPDQDYGVVHRGKFMAVVGLMASALAIVGILMELYPVVVMGPCAGS